MIWDWILKFFSYSFGDGSPSTFSDGLGEGSFGIRHFIWIAVVILIAIIGYQLCKRHPKTESKIVLILVISLFLVRFSHQTLRAVIGVEVPWTKAFPFHMCTVLTFLLPLTVIFDWKKIKTPVYVLSIMGGVITLILGDYFNDRFMTFWNLEGMSAHTILILVPIFEIAAGRIKLDLKESWQVIIGILVLMGWAMLANLVFFKGTDPNYMYLMENELPFGNDQNYFFFYTLIFIVFLGVIYGSPVLKRRILKRGSQK